MSFEHWKELIPLLTPLVVQLYHAWLSARRYRRRQAEKRGSEGEGR